jgi:hypothetical protein
MNQKTEKMDKKFERFDMKSFNFFKYAPQSMTDNDVRQTSEVCLAPKLNFFDSKIKCLYFQFDDITNKHKGNAEWIRFYKLAHYFYVACWMDTGMKAANQTKIRDYLAANKGLGLVDVSDKIEWKGLIKRVEHDYHLGLRVNPVKISTASNFLRRQHINPANFWQLRALIMVSPSFLHLVYPTNFRGLHNSDFDQIRKYMEIHGYFAQTSHEAFPTRDVPEVPGTRVELDRNRYWIESGANYYVISDSDDEEDNAKGNERGYLVIEE